MLSLHKCTQEDYDGFHEIAESQNQLFQKIYNGQQDGFYCIDWPDDLVLGNQGFTSPITQIDFIFTPCNYVHQELGDIGDKVTDECVSDLDAIKKYLGPLEMMILANTDRFNQLGYG